MTNASKRLLVENLVWSKEMLACDSNFFQRLAEGQSPEVLWIGCSDSRVPAEKITNSRPGALFVHRNIANIAGADDCNAMSVVEYAVHVLKVKHIIVCGHYRCGGIRAALSPQIPELHFVNQRIACLRTLAQQHDNDLAPLASLDEKADRLAELNVMYQVKVLADLPLIQSAQTSPSIHGWIFSIDDGRLKVLSTSPEQDRTITQSFNLIPA